MQGRRRKARESVLKLLYSLEFNRKEDLDEVIKDYIFLSKRHFIDDFAKEIFLGVINNLEKIDNYIKKYTKNWKIERIALVEKNIMRIAIYEMLERDDIPNVVSINEAVDIAKKYSTYDSGKFVNGILDKINKDIQQKI